jgi:sec-independent protein translocase protein TatA
MELMVIGVIAVMLFGNRLPEVGRSLGKGLIEFKKGLRDIQSEVDISNPSSSSSSSSRVAYRNPIDETSEATAPKFVPPTQEPIATEAPVASAPPVDSTPSVDSTSAHV